MPTQKILDQFLIFVNLYQYANPAICLAESILVHISGARPFPNTEHNKFQETKQIISILIKKQIQSKVITYCFESKIFFSKNSGSVTHNFIWVSITELKLRKN